MPKPNLSSLDDLLGNKPNPKDDGSVDFVEISPAHFETKTVPNVFPLITNQSYRLAIIGEAPGADEIREGKPFVGASGRFLTALLSKANIIRDACFIGNVCQHRPPNNEISNFSLDGSEIQQGLAALATDLARYNPNVILLLGKTALWAANGAMKIDDWRGTFFIGTKGAFAGRKCIAAPHPARCLRIYRNTPLLMFDILKSKGQANTPTLTQPYRDLRIDLSVEQIISELEKIERNQIKTSIDIEGYVEDMWCYSVATSPERAFLVPFQKFDGSSYWSLDDEILIWKATASYLANPKCKKILQNGLYDLFVFLWSYDIVVGGFSDDTMLKSWELYCEIAKKLGVLISLYNGTEPYYKFERKSGSYEIRSKYCCKDSANTFEISNYLDKSPISKEHYKFNMELLYPILYIERHGLLYDKVKADQRLKEVDAHIQGLQYKLDQCATSDYLIQGQVFGLEWHKPKAELLHFIRSLMGWKKNPTKPVKKFEPVYDKCVRLLLGPADLTIEEKGFLSIACGRSMNIKSSAKNKRKALTKEIEDEFESSDEEGESSPDLSEETDPKVLRGFKHYIYEILKLPKQYVKDPKTKKEHLSTNYESLLKLSKKSSHPAIQLAIDISSLRTRSQMLHISCDNDGRIRAGYNIVGSETGRITCYTSPTGSGYALQTLPDADPLKPFGHPLHLGMRDLVIADPGCYLGKCDLKGADGWTVGAHLNRLGDPTMLNDLLYGIKPAQVLCWMMRHKREIPSSMPRDEVKELCKEVKKDDWDYFAYKQCIWGFCYLMGARKAASHVFNLSEGKVDLGESKMEEAKTWLFRRYHVQLWWQWTGDFLRRQKYPPNMTSASGHIRKFFNREKDRLGEALAHEPQANTTYATNSAARNLWYDPENRVVVNGRTELRVKPMHQVHDELLLQWKIEDTDWAITKIKQWFNNLLAIAGQQITIPFEGSYGLDWSMSEESKKGSI